MILLLAGLATAACPSLDAQLERATGALVRGDAATVDAALLDADASFACAPATRASVARWALVEGARRVVRGQDGDAWLAAARHLAPQSVDPRLGPAVRAAFDAAPSPAVATLLLEPAIPAFVDGVPIATWPLTLPAGPHAVQVMEASGAVRFGRALTLLPGEDALLPTGLPASVAAEVAGTGSTASAPAVAVAPAARRPALLITAASLAAVGGGLAGAALAQTPRMEAAADLDALDAARGAQQGLAWGAYGAFGAAAVTGVLFVVVR
jgi:hypothetical protein